MVPAERRGALMMKTKRRAQQRSSGDPLLARAQRFLKKVPLVDGHNDLPWVIYADPDARGDVIAYDLKRVHQEGDTDIPRLKQSGLAAQFWSAFVPTEIAHPARSVLEVIDVWRRMNEAHPDIFMPATKASDVARAKRAGKIASFLTVEGGVGLENSLAPLRIWYAAGARLMVLSHNETLDWVDSATDERRHGGLTAFGREVVHELNRLGMIVDLAHVTAEVMHQVLDLTKAPIVFSHSNARALCNHPRNVPDDVLKRVPQNGGVVMLTFVPEFINQATLDWALPLKDSYFKGRKDIDRAEAYAQRAKEQGPPPQATLSQLCDHIEYVTQLIGVKHVGIGSDFFGGDTPHGLEDVSRFPYLIAELMRRGWSESALAALASGNFLRVFRAVERVGKTLRQSEMGKLLRHDDFSEDGKKFSPQWRS